MTKQANAVIYVRGNNEEFQEMMCRLCAADKGYKVLYATKHFKDVDLCDVLLVTDPTRISRNELEYHRIVREFGEKGIRIEYAVDTGNIDNITLLMKEMFK